MRLWEVEKLSIDKISWVCATGCDFLPAVFFHLPKFIQILKKKVEKKIENFSVIFQSAKIVETCDLKINQNRPLKIAWKNSKPTSFFPPSYISRVEKTWPFS